jgi:hypothetical protein
MYNYNFWRQKARDKEKTMGGKTHIKSIIISAFLAFTAMSAAAINQALGVSYKVIDLNPSGFSDSIALGASGIQQVGYGSNHALLWNGSASSFIDLNPSGFNTSRATGISGTQQVGWIASSAWGGPYGSAGTHAFLWYGSAASRIDLHPSGYAWSEALGINGMQQVGRGFISDFNYHALLWSGSAESCVDLNPSGYSYSEALGTNGTQQVGWGYGSATDGNNHALLWSSSAGSVIDLNQFLPAGFSSISYATAIDGSGNIVGYATDISGANHAILWQLIPEPGTIVFLTLGSLALLSKRRS